MPGSTADPAGGPQREDAGLRARTGHPAASRTLEVDPKRLSRWVESFAERHGAVAAEQGPATVTFLAADGARAECDLPFPPLAAAISAPGDQAGERAAGDQAAGELTAGELTAGELTAGELAAGELAARIAAHALADRTVGVFLVRLGGYAAGVFTGPGPALEASKVGSRLVHGRSSAGGQSQQRFARRREKQAREAVTAAADTAVAIFGPFAKRLDAVVLGGDRRAIAGLRADRRLAPYFALAVDRFLTVPDPRLTVLRDTPRLFRAVRIRLTEPASDISSRLRA